MEALKLGLQEFWNIFERREDFDSQKFLNLLNDTDEETVLKILAIFNDTLLKGALSVDDAVKTDNPDEVWKLAHKVAGTSELLGLISFGKASRELSQNVKKDPNIRRHMNAIKDFINYAKSLSEDIEKSCKVLIKYRV